MPAPRPTRLAPEWDDRFSRMVGLSAVGHLVAIAVVLVLAERAAPRPLPLIAYTVEITDPSALGGRLPPGAPARDLSGGATREAPPEPPKPEAPPEPPPAPSPPEPPPPPEAAKPPEPPPPPPEAKKEPEPEPPPPEEPEVRLPDKTKPPAPKPPPKAEPPKAAKPEPPKPAAKTEPRPSPPPKAEAKADAKAKPSAATGTSTRQDAPARDAYAAAAERWRSKSGGGLGGTNESSGPIGAGGEGPGGGGQLVGIEFLAYRQQVITTIKAQWTNVIARPGLVAAVRFAIAPDGEVSDVRLAQSSGNPAYDASALRAVQHVTRLPPPPARYAGEFREFQIEFHSEERGGQGTG
jgi:TonB family protein